MDRLGPPLAAVIGGGGNNPTKSHYFKPHFDFLMGFNRAKKPKLFYVREIFKYEIKFIPIKGGEGGVTLIFL